MSNMTTAVKPVKQKIAEHLAKSGVPMAVICISAILSLVLFVLTLISRDNLECCKNNLIEKKVPMDTLFGTALGIFSVLFIGSIIAIIKFKKNKFRIGLLLASSLVCTVLIILVMVARSKTKCEPNASGDGTPKQLEGGMNIKTYSIVGIVFSVLVLIIVSILIVVALKHNGKGAVVTPLETNGGVL